MITIKIPDNKVSIAREICGEHISPVTSNFVFRSNKLGAVGEGWQIFWEERTNTWSLSIPSEFESLVSYIILHE